MGGGSRLSWISKDNAYLPQRPRHGAGGGVGVDVERLPLLAHPDGRDDGDDAGGEEVLDDLCGCFCLCVCVFLWKFKG